MLPKKNSKPLSEVAIDALEREVVVPADVRERLLKHARDVVANANAQLSDGDASTEALGPREPSGAVQPSTAEQGSTRSLVAFWMSTRGAVLRAAVLVVSVLLVFALAVLFPRPELVAFALGTCALAGVMSVATRGPTILRAAAGAISAVSILVLACHSASAQHDRLAADRDAALLLNALLTRSTPDYPGDPLPLLRERVLSRNQYYLAYHDFKEEDREIIKQYPKAKSEFQNLLNEQRYVAQDHYLLARMAQQQSNFVEAAKHLDEAIRIDPKYAAPYYLRAIVRMRSLPADALVVPSEIFDDLHTATQLYVGCCIDVFRKDEIAKEWRRISSDPRFEELQKECKSTYDLPLKDGDYFPDPPTAKP